MRWRGDRGITLQQSCLLYDYSSTIVVPVASCKYNHTLSFTGCTFLIKLYIYFQSNLQEMLNSFGKECITKYLLDCRTRANRHIHYRIIRRTPKSQHWWTIYFLSCMLKNLYNFVVPYKLDIHSLFHFNTPLYLLTFSPTLLPCYC
jgi:hypothetical protein